jgi:hypothetical protein
MIIFIFHKILQGHMNHKINVYYFPQLYSVQNFLLDVGCHDAPSLTRDTAFLCNHCLLKINKIMLLDFNGNGSGLSSFPYMETGSSNFAWRMKRSFIICSTILSTRVRFRPKNYQNTTKRQNCYFHSKTKAYN